MPFYLLTTELTAETPQWLLDLKTKAIDYAPSFVAGVLTLLIGWWVAKIIRGVLRRILSKKVDSTLTSFLCSLSYMAMVTLVVISALGKFGANTGSFVAIIGAAGLALGFALQGSLANFAAGVMIIAFRPFKEGDFVELGGIAGIVLEIQIFATVMKTGDNKRITIPNSNITGANITNYSAHPTRRVDMVFGISYGDDLRQAKEVLEGILAKDERILKDPAPVVAVSELGDSSVNFVVRPWVNTADYWSVYWDTHEAVKLGFDAAGVSIPFPQTDVHLHRVDVA